MHPFFSGFLGLVLGAVASVALIVSLASCSSPVKGQPYRADLPTFPSVTGTNLNRRQIEIPAGLDAPFAVLMVAFYQRQQPDVDTWLPIAREIAADHPNVEYYELPTIASEWGLVRGWVDGGMRSGIPALAARERTVTVYTDTAAFRSLAGIDDPARIWTGLVDREGRVHWSARGRATPEDAAELRRMVRTIASPGAD